MSVENELKYKISEDSYQKLLKIVKPRIQKVSSQINYYFDTPDLHLRKKKVGLRVRVINNKQAMLTIKYPAKQRKEDPWGFKRRIEIECPISIQTAKLFVKNPKKIFEKNTRCAKLLFAKCTEAILESLKHLGVSKNKRILYPLSKKLVMEIDRCDIFGEKFYEVEVESHHPSTADKTIRKFFHENNIAFSPSRKSKLARFIENWKRVNRQNH